MYYIEYMGFNSIFNEVVTDLNRIEKFNALKHKYKGPIQMPLYIYDSDNTEPETAKFRNKLLANDDYDIDYSRYPYEHV